MQSTRGAEGTLAPLGWAGLRGFISESSGGIEHSVSSTPDWTAKGSLCSCSTERYQLAQDLHLPVEKCAQQAAWAAQQAVAKLGRLASLRRTSVPKSGVELYMMIHL